MFVSCTGTIVLLVVFLTAGLKRPPVTRKKAQTLTTKAKPKESAEYKRLDVFGFAPGGGFGVFDT